MAEIFRTTPLPARHGRVDAAQGVIYAVCAAQALEAAGHELLFDAHSLEQLLELGSQKPGGIKCRFAHPGLLSDGLGRYLGRMKAFRLEQGRLLGDLYLSASAAKAPGGDLRQYILALAQEDPAAFGISVVVDLTRVWVLQNGDERPAYRLADRPAESRYAYPVARISGFFAADCVDEAALNPQGLFQHLNLPPVNDAVGGDSPIKPQPDDKEQIMSVETNFDSVQPGIPSQDAALNQLESRLESLRQQVSDQQAALAKISQSVEQRTVQVGGTPPRESRLTVGLSGLDHFQHAFDWVFGVEGSPMPPPDLRRTDQLYRILTGDLAWHGVFDPAYAFAGATTTTLADLAANAMNKVIVDLYNRLWHYRWYEMIAAVQPTDGTLQDMAWIQFGGIANLPTVAEGAAYTELDLADSKESDSFVKYGGYVGITDKMIRNSEIAKMQAIPRALTISAIQTRSAAIAGIFTSNSGVGPTLDQDSTALFHTNHANLATTAYSWSAWKAARLECAKQTELGSAKRQMLFPKFLLLPADLYDQALIDFGYGAGPGGRPGEGSVTSFQDVNPYAQDRPGDPRPTPIAVPEFTDTGDWAYLVDPKIAPVICMAYASNPGGRTHPAPELFTVTSPLAGLIFTNDTIPIKIRDWFAYGVATYRGIGKRNVA